MPCQYYSPEEERNLANEEAAKYKKELDRVTELLCGITKLIYFTVNNKKLTKSFEGQVPGLYEWYVEHYKMDELRMKDSIKKKLTEEELKYLNLGS